MEVDTEVVVRTRTRVIIDGASGGGDGGSGKGGSGGSKGKSSPCHSYRAQVPLTDQTEIA